MDGEAKIKKVVPIALLLTLVQNFCCNKKATSSDFAPTTSLVLATS